MGYMVACQSPRRQHRRADFGVAEQRSIPGSVRVSLGVQLLHAAHDARAGAAAGAVDII